MSSDHPQERRHFRRIPFDAEAALSSPNGQWRSTLVDLSLNGALLERPAGWMGTTGESCTLHIHLGGDMLISMNAEVAHIDDTHIGLHCTHIDLDSVAHLRRFVELNLGDPALLERELSALGTTHGK
ncbi:MAG: PilZ domain-containing protein [Pseudomonadota bacterium]